MNNNDFQELRQIWQQPDSKPSTTTTSNRKKSAVWERIEQFQQKIRRENIWITLCFVATTAVLGFIWYSYDWQHLYTSMGIILIILAMGGSLYFFFQRVMAKRYRDMGQPSSDYIKEALQKLEYQHMIIQRIIPLYGFILIAGLNLAYLDILADTSLWIKVSAHLLLTVGLAGFFYVTRKKRLQKFNDQYGKDINNLKSMLDDLNK